MAGSLTSEARIELAKSGSAHMVEIGGK
jgi:hypothetical protein